MNITKSKLLAIALLLCTVSLLKAEDNFTYALIGNDESNVYEEASKDSKVITALEKGQLIKVLSKSEHFEQGVSNSEDINHFFWYQIEIDDSKGWVFGDQVFHIDNDNESLTRHFAAFRNEDIHHFSFHIAKQYAYEITTTELEGWADEPYIHKEAYLRYFAGHSILILLEHGTNADDIIDTTDKVHLLTAGKSIKSNYNQMPTLKGNANLKQAFFKDERINLLIASPYDYAYIRVLEINFDSKNNLTEEIFFIDND